MVFWTLCRKYRPNWTFSVAILYVLIHCIELNLVVRDQVAPMFQIKDKKSNANEFLYYFLEANLLNYMDIRYTVFVFIPLFVLGTIFIQKAASEISL